MIRPENEINSYTTYRVNKVPLAQLVADWLSNAHVVDIFFLPGASIDELLKHLLQDGRFHCRAATHESTAAFMADGAFRVTRRPTAVLSSSGPGALNMVTAAYTCAEDQIPVIFITGDNPSFLSDCRAFQHVGNDACSINAVFNAVGCPSHRILKGEELNEAFSRFYDALLRGSPIPLHLSIPCDIALAPFSSQYTPEYQAVADPDMFLYNRPGLNGTDKPPRRAAMWLGDHITDESFERLKKLAIAGNVPVAVTMNSLYRLTELPEQLRLGAFGYAGHEASANLILDPELDLLIIAGVELTERNTCCWHQDIWHPNRDVLMVCREMRHKWPIPLEITMICADKESKITHQLTDPSGMLVSRISIHKDWRSSFDNEINKNNFNLPLSTQEHKLPISVGSVCKLLAYSIIEDQNVFADAGDHKYFAAYHLAQKLHPRFHAANQTSPMGWAIGAGIGAAAAQGETRTIIITGDGCMLMHGSELSTAVKYQLPVTIIIINNKGYGKIRRRFETENTSKENQPGSLPEIDWTCFMKSIGIPCAEVTTNEEMIRSLDNMNKIVGPYSIIVDVNEDEDYPNPAAMFSACSRKFIENWMEDKYKCNA